MAGSALPPLGFIGLGLMGQPITLRLLAAGYPVAVWNRTASRTRAVTQAGAVAVESPAAVARAAQVVFLCVSDTAAVEEVVFGAQGIREEATGDRLLVDLSSIQPDATREMAQRLAAETGMHWVDSPVSGGVRGAEQGTLAVMAGGDAADVDRVRPMMAHLAQRFTHMGPSGAGQTTKLCNQVIVGCTLAVLAEATRLAMDAGIDAARLPECLKGGFADSIPMQLFVPRMVAGEFEPASTRIKTILKDVDTARDVGRETNTTLPMTALASELYRSLVAAGQAEGDLSRLITLYPSGSPGR